MTARPARILDLEGEVGMLAPGACADLTVLGWNGNAAPLVLAIGSATSQVAVLTVTGVDRDGDGMPDAWEIANGTNPDAADAGADPDIDGLTNFQEYLAGTGPTNALSVLRIDSISLVGGSATTRLTFNALSNRTYTVQWRQSLDSGTWQKLADVVALSSDGVVSVTNATAGSNAHYYRLVTPQQP